MGSACLVGVISILERIKARVNKIVIVACLFVDKMSCFCSFGSCILCYDWKQWCIQVIAPCYMQYIAPCILCVCSLCCLYCAVHSASLSPGNIQIPLPTFRTVNDIFRILAIYIPR